MLKTITIALVLMMSLNANLYARSYTGMGMDKNKADEDAIDTLKSRCGTDERNRFHLKLNATIVSVTCKPSGPLWECTYEYKCR